MSAQPQRPAHDLTSADIAAHAQSAYGEALRELGRFNLAIFGKTGVGKSTLINAIFGSEVAATGTGRPVTLKTAYYEHPSGYFGMYDSEGIEVGQEGDQILAKFRSLIEERKRGPVSKQIHVIWYCVRAADLRFEDAQAEFVRQLAADGVPVLFVLTQVQTRDGEIHPEVRKLAESVMERDLPLAGGNRVFFTMAQPDDFGGFPAHGLRDLLDATFRVAPDAVEAALIAAQKIDLERKVRKARTYIKAAAATAAGIGATPIPIADAALLVPVQVGLMAKIAAIFGLNITTGTFASVAGAAFTAGGLTQAGRYLATTMLKFVPGAGTIVGGTIRAGVASSLTFAVGEAWIVVCSQLHALGPRGASALESKAIREMFVAALRERSGEATKRLPLGRGRRAER
ncbi:GTPase family protein [Capillimicrobium parvum]|uniref:G domain-containing protein n=1 Tax=Capillimicrobium parvum TaxID=2884022 RepID=A0A9E6Y1Z9_9ACTN|nr:GTP-binding DUF697 domain-containing protein [Capillimicrobium parvum]UGS38486.1 hypothetical protein DSM104329_04915 [Capillimicrobium parvum]